MLTCTLSTTYSQDQVTPSLELGTSKGSMISAVVAGMSKAGTPDHTNAEDKSLPISHCYRDLKRGFLLKRRGDVQTTLTSGATEIQWCPSKEWKAQSRCRVSHSEHQQPLGYAAVIKMESPDPAWDRKCSIWEKRAVQWKKIWFEGVGLFDRKGQLKGEKKQRMWEDTAVVETADTCARAKKLNKVHNPECRTRVRKPQMSQQAK